MMPTMILHCSIAIALLLLFQVPFLLALVSQRATAFGQRRCHYKKSAAKQFQRQGPALVRLYAGNPRDEEADDDEDSDEVLSPQTPSADTIPQAKSNNVLGTPLKPCCTNVGGSGIGTGFYRNGYCSTGEQDLGRHTVCVKVTDKFLSFSASVGNDLSTPAPQWSFCGLKEGDIWCLCAERWAQAYNAQMAPQLYLEATHEKTLTYISLEILMEYALDKDEAGQVIQKLNDQRAQLEKLL